MSDPLQTILAEFLDFLPGLLAALVIFLVTLYLATLISRLIRRSLEKQRVDPALTLLLF